MTNLEKFFKTISIKGGQRVLDFGCGSGNYTISIAKVVGRYGLVYAVDKDKDVLNKLKKRIDYEELKNVILINTGGGIRIDLDDEAVDAIILYDVFHGYYFYIEERRKLLNEIRRISKPNALVSVFPTHMRPDDVKNELEEAGFRFIGKNKGTLIHHNDLEKGTVLNFRKS